MDKDADAFRTISEVGEELDLPQHVLRFWESRFPQIRPVKRGGGRRYYRPEDCDLLRGIKHLLYGEGYTIKGVQRILKEEGARTVQAVGRAGQLPAESIRRSVSSHVAPADPLSDGSQDVYGAAPLSTEGWPEPHQDTSGPRHSLRHEPILERGSERPSPSISVAREHGHRPMEARVGSAAPDPLASGSASVGVTRVAASSVRRVRVDPAAPSLPGFDPVADWGAAPRKAKPKQLALFEGMEAEGLSGKDREALRQALTKIAECRKILASADLLDTAPALADPRS